LEGVSNFQYERGGAKWGRIHLREEKQLEAVVASIRKSYALIREAIKNNETTGWYAALEEDDAEEDVESTES
jgi:hypothetical protein